MNLPIRPRRNRKSAAVRGLMRETTLSAANLIYPMFVQEGDEDTPIESLPGCTRWSVAGIAEECKRLYALGISCVDLFAVVPEEKKDAAGSEAWNPEGVVPRAIRAIKAAVPELCVMTDVALDPFNTYGQDGLVREYEDGSYEILNDETVEALCRQALCHARAGADIISPSDMMDGRIAALRAALDAAEGADFLMVKPATLYLDVISEMRRATTLPIAAYHVSGEYLMVKAAAASGWLDEKQCMLEALLSIRRAGADMILTYAAPQVAEWLDGGCL